MDSQTPTDYPTLEDLKAAHIEDPEFVLQVQQKAYAAYSKSLGYQKGKRSFINGYPIKPNAIEIGFEKYKDMIIQKGDDRNDYLYGELKDSLRDNIAYLLGSKRPQDIALGINATTFVVQILTHYWGAPLKILTTNEEFYGTVRVLSRLKEVPGVTITEVRTDPFETYAERWLEEAGKEQYDVAILSHIPFKSANVLTDMDVFVRKLKEKVNKIVIDGSSAFGNLPIDLILGSAIDDVYYIGGIYKFMGAGEGFAFMSLPKDCKDRPVLTGWVFGDYTDESHYYSKPLYYAEDGDRYANSTLECSVWLRVNEIMEYFKRENYTVEMKNRYTTILKHYMIRKLDEANISFISSRNLLSKFGKWKPLQTCFELANEKISSKELCKKLLEYNVEADFRGTILRLCPATYHTIFDIDFLVAKLKEIDNELSK